MSIIALQVESAKAHPNADTLRVYTFTGPNQTPLRVVANETNIYGVGDVVAVAQVGTVLDDGMKIRPTSIRGVTSFGMALGRVDDALGSDLTARFGASQEVFEETGRVIKWASVELLHNVRREVEGRWKAGVFASMPSVIYRAKVKLDGTNGGVQIWPSGRVVAQSRTRALTPSDDNAGFGAWVASAADDFAALARPEGVTVVYGEWSGPGIQKRTSVSKIDRKIFAVFAIQYGDHNIAPAMLETRPEQLAAALPARDDVFVLPWQGDPVTLDFKDTDALKATAETINAHVAEVERCDPWVADTFGVRGLGEGLVFYPETDGLIERDGYSELMFKAKGDKHQVVKQKKPAQIDPEFAANVAEFVALFVTPARLEQAVAEGCDGELNMRRMGHFLKWIGQDIRKESAAELEASDLTWKDVSKATTTAARDWYKDACMKL